VAPAQLDDSLKDIQGTAWPESVHYPAVVKNEKEFRTRGTDTSTNNEIRMTLNATRGAEREEKSWQKDFSC